MAVRNLHGQERRRRVDGAQVHLGAVAAADHVGEHPHPLLRKLQQVGQHVAQGVRAHGAGPQRQHARGVVEGDGDVGLQMRVLHELGRERVLDDEIALRPRGIDIAAAKLEVVRDIAVGHGVQHEAGHVRALVGHLIRVDQWCPRRDRFHHVEHAGQLLVVDDDPLDRLLGGVLVLRRHGRHHRDDARSLPR